MKAARTFVNLDHADRIAPARFADLSQDRVIRSMRRFADEVMPAFRGE